MTEKSNARHSLADNFETTGAGITPEDIIPLLAQWSREEIEAFVETLRTFLDDDDPGPSGGAAVAEQAEKEQGGSKGSSGRSAGGWVELRMVNGCGPYAYRRWWDSGRKRSQYIGKVKKESAAA